eukprot:gene46399-1400_t
MVAGKTSGLFRLTVRLMRPARPREPSVGVVVLSALGAMGQESRRDFGPLLNKMGLYFQILDDYLNLKSGLYHKNKSFCEDITEGKWSFPILHSVHTTGAADTRLRRIVRQRSDDEGLK